SCATLYPSRRIRCACSPPLPYSSRFTRRPPPSTPFPYTTLFRSDDDAPATAGPYPRLVGEDRNLDLKGRVGADGHRGWLGALADELCGQGGDHHAVIGA